MSEETDSGQTTVGTPSRRLTDAEFAEIREHYELGTKGLVDLADEFGVSRQTLSKRFKDAGVKKGSRAHELAAAAKSSAATVVVERFSEKQEAWIEETRLAGYKALKRAEMLTHKIVIENERAGKPASEIEADVRTMQRYNRIIADNVRARLKLLKAEDYVGEEDLPALVIEDLTDEEILDHHKLTGAVPEDMTVEEMLAEEIGDIPDLPPGDPS